MRIKPDSDYLNLQFELDRKRSELIIKKVHQLGLTHFWSNDPQPGRPIVITGKRELFEVLVNIDFSKWTQYDCTWWGYVDELTPSQISQIKREMYYPDKEVFQELTSK